MVTIISVLYYTQIEVDGAKNLDVLILLGKIATSINTVANNARNIDVIIRAIPYVPVTQLTIDMQEYIDVLIDIHENLIDDLRRWDTCSGNEMFTDEKIPI